MGHLIAGEMGFELRGLGIGISGNLNPDRLFGKSNADRAGYKEITVELKPDCDADAATLGRWMQAVEDRCPVSDNLQNQTLIRLAVAN